MRDCPTMKELVESDSTGRYDFSYSTDGNGSIDILNTWTGYVVISSDSFIDDYGDFEIDKFEYKELDKDDRIALANALMLLAIKGWDNGVLKSRIKNTDILNLI